MTMTTFAPDLSSNKYLSVLKQLRFDANAAPCLSLARFRVAVGMLEHCAAALNTVFDVGWEDAMTHVGISIKDAFSESEALESASERELCLQPLMWVIESGICQAQYMNKLWTPDAASPCSDQLAGPSCRTIAPKLLELKRCLMEFKDDKDFSGSELALLLLNTRGIAT